MLHGLEEAKRRAAHALFRSETIKIDLAEGFIIKAHERFPDAPRSPIYVSMRPKGTKGGQLSEADIAVISESMTVYSLLRGLFSDTNFVSGIPEAGEPFVDGIMSFTDNLNVTRLYLQKSETDGKRCISGVRDDNLLLVREGEACLLVDDLVTGADTKLEAVNAIRRQGMLVSDLLVFLDRSADATSLLAEHDVTLHSIWKFDELLYFASEHGYISHEQRDHIIGYPAILENYINTHS